MWTERPLRLAAFPRAHGLNLGAQESRHGTGPALTVPGRYAKASVFQCLGLQPLENKPRIALTLVIPLSVDETNKATLACRDEVRRLPGGVLEKEASSAAGPGQAEAEGPESGWTGWGRPHVAVASEAEHSSQTLTGGCRTPVPS